MKKDKLEELFSSLEGLEQTPPPELWDAIENQLDKPKKKHRVVAWRWYGAAACLLIGLGWLVVPVSTVTKNELVQPQLDSTLAPLQRKLIRNNETDYAESQKISNKSSLALEEVFQEESMGASPKNGVVLRDDNLKNEVHPKRGLNTNKIQLALNQFEDSISDDLSVDEKTTLPAIDTSEEGVAVIDNAIVMNDSIAELVKAELAELDTSLQQEGKEEDMLLDETIDQRWSLQVFTSVLNSKQGETLNAASIDNSSQAYGLKTNYHINDKWKFRFGINVNDFGQQLQTSKQVELTESPGTPAVHTNLGPSEPIIEEPLASEPAAMEPSQSENEINVTVIDPVNHVVNDAPQTKTTEITKRREKLRYLELPLELSYGLFQKKKMSVSVNSGGVLGRLISNKQYINGVNVGANAVAKDYIYGLLLSTTMQYQIFKQAYLYAEPGMNYYIQPVESQNLRQVNPTIQMGLSYKF